MHPTAPRVATELVACIRCNECLEACPALAAPLPIAAVNQQTLDGPVSPEIARFAQACILCGACVPVCPVGLHRDAMMLWLKMRLLRGAVPVAAPLPDDAGTDPRVSVPALKVSHAIPHAVGRDPTDSGEWVRSAPGRLPLGQRVDPAARRSSRRRSR